MNQTNGVLKENEKQANRIAAQVMRITVLLFTIAYILNLIGIFVVDNKIMTTAYFIGSGVLLIPTVLVNVYKMEQSFIKYITIGCSIIFIMIVTTTLSFHVVIAYVYAIAIASLYFSKKLNIIATVLTVIAVSIGQILTVVLQIWPDRNFLTLYRTIIYGVVPRAMILVAIAAIFTMLCQRTTAMLGNLMGAEEQKEVLDQMRKMKKKVLF